MASQRGPLRCRWRLRRAVHAVSAVDVAAATASARLRCRGGGCGARRRRGGGLLRAALAWAEQPQRMLH